MFNRRRRQSETNRVDDYEQKPSESVASEPVSEPESMIKRPGDANQPTRRRDDASAVDSVTKQRFDELKREVGLEVPDAPASVPAPHEAVDQGVQPASHASSARRPAPAGSAPAHTAREVFGDVGGAAQAEEKVVDIADARREARPHRDAAANPISNRIPPAPPATVAPAVPAPQRAARPAAGREKQVPKQKPAPEPRRVWNPDGTAGFKPVDSIPQYEGRFAHIGEDPHARIRRGNPAAGNPSRSVGATRDERLGRVTVHARSLLSATEHNELINWKARLARETPLYRRAFAMGDIKKVADIGCGSGQQAIMFAEWGLDVIGVESDEKLLRRAQSLARDHDQEISSARGSIRFKRAGIERLDETLGDEKVNAIVCVGDMLPRAASLSAIRRTLEGFARALAPSGILVLEFVNHTAFTQKKIRATRPEVYDTVAGTKVFLEVMDYPAGSSVVDTDFVALTRGEDGKWSVESTRRQNIFVSPTGITRELYDVGFDVVELAGDFDGNELSIYNDDTIVIIARRKRHSVRARHGRSVEQERPAEQPEAVSEAVSEPASAPHAEEPADQPVAMQEGADTAAGHLSDVVLADAQDAQEQPSQPLQGELVEQAQMELEEPDL